MVALYLNISNLFLYLVFTVKSDKIFVCFSRFIYPAIIVLIVSTISFPKGSGQFIASQVRYHTPTIKHMLLLVTCIFPRPPETLINP